MSERLRTVAWAKDDPFGAEQASIRLRDGGLEAAGVAIGSSPVPYRLDYELETDDGLVTRRLHVAATGDGWRRTLDLRRDDAGWQADATVEGQAPLHDAPGVDLAALGSETLDCDLGLSPVTNTLPVRRHRFLRDGPRDFTMAWVSVPDLAVHPERQRYTFVRDEPGGEVLVRFDSLDGSFTADILFDADGLVLDYPGIARRLRP